MLSKHTEWLINVISLVFRSLIVNPKSGYYLKTWFAH